MIDTVLNLLFRCSHRHLSRPLTRPGQAGVRSSESYIVCLDCGKQFAYDVEQMRIGKPINHAKAAQPKSKLKIAMWTAVPLVTALGIKWRSAKSERGKP